VIPLSGRESSAEILIPLSGRRNCCSGSQKTSTEHVPTLAASVREGVSGGVQALARASRAAAGVVCPILPFWPPEGRYQNPCRYQLRYLISADSKEVRAKGSEVATSEPLFSKPIALRSGAIASYQHLTTRLRVAPFARICLKRVVDPPW